MKKLNFILKSAIFLSIFCLFGVHISYAEKDIPVEGIVYEAKDPSQSLVSIGGQLYKKGAQYDGFEIVEVKQDRVVVKDANGKTSEHHLNFNASFAPAVSKTLADSSSPGQPADQNTFEKSFEQMKKMLGLEGDFNFTDLLSFVTEIGVKADMRKLYTQASIALSESDGEALTMDKMIEMGFVAAGFKEERNGYRFRIGMGRMGAEVFADPVNGSSRTKHFMIDDNGDMREERGQPATAKSPLVKIGLLPEGLRIKQPQNLPTDELAQN